MGQVIDSTTVKLNWAPPPYTNQNGIIRKYIIKATEMETGNRFSWESFTTSIEVPTLHPYYTYQFTVAAYTVAVGPYTNPVNFRTHPDSKSSHNT